MDAVILSAGFGRRLHPLTKDRPKPLVRIGKRTLISFAIFKLFQAGVSRLFVNGYYKAHMLREYLKGIHGIDVVFSQERYLLGTGGGIKQFERFLSESFVVHNCDIIYDFGISTYMQTFLESDLDALLLATHGSENKLIVSKSYVVGFGKGIYTYIGIAFLRRSILAYFPHIGSFVQGLSRAIEQGRKVGYMLVDGFWTDVGRTESFSKFITDNQELTI